MNNGTRPALKRLFDFIRVALVVIAALILAYGAFKWPDAPIRETAGGVVGKTGSPHTREEYEMFELWKKSLLVAFPLAFAVNFIAVIAERKRKKERLKS